ncbi:MAG: hypothetical protein JO166_13645 [Deltaproteobacteria bacterium]|nr:hypothetical protein [Deltaproteobacteria bacterium]
MCDLESICYARIGSDYGRHQSSTPEAAGGFVITRSQILTRHVQEAFGVRKNGPIEAGPPALVERDDQFHELDRLIVLNLRVRREIAHGCWFKPIPRRYGYRGGSNSCPSTSVTTISAFGTPWGAMAAMYPRPEQFRHDVVLASGA